LALIIFHALTYCFYNIKTEGLIKDVVDKQILEDARMVLINALLFDAKWSNKYEKSDVFENQSFYNYDGSESKVTMLASSETFYKGADYVAMSKYYAGNQYSLFAILPDEGIDVYDFMAGIDADKWFEIVNSNCGRADVELPEFKYECNMDLVPVLQNLGVEKIFCDSADLTGLGTYTNGGSTYVGDAIQKTNIEVDKNGTKAAAVTIIVTKNACAPMDTNKVILNRPFVYAIMDNNTGLPLFLGVMAWAN